MTDQYAPVPVKHQRGPLKRAQPHNYVERMLKALRNPLGKRTVLFDASEEGMKMLSLKTDILRKGKQAGYRVRTKVLKAEGKVQAWIEDEQR